MIKLLKSNKRPGLDGFTVTYYKQFATLLALLLVGAFNSLLDGHSVPLYTLMAIISILPKPHSDDSSWTNSPPP